MIDKIYEQILSQLNVFLDSKEINRQILSIETPPSPEMGDFAIPCFKAAPLLKASPTNIATELAAFFETYGPIEQVEAVGPYVNIHVNSGAMAQSTLQALDDLSLQTDKPEQYMVEFSSPNTNKPQHVGHVRNNLLGMAVSNLLKVSGHDVIRANLINNRGIHICQALAAYENEFMDAKSPFEMKGDHYVGEFYVRYHQLEADEPELKERAEQMLRDWESGEPIVRALWEWMNRWVYEGFNQTYARMGVEFDRVYYESDLYLDGKAAVEKSDVFETLDGARVFDLAELGMEGKKVLLRSDGTSVYMTQDIGVAQNRLQEFPELDHLIYVVGDAQRDHFRILFEILKLLGIGEECDFQHYSYGMVDLPDGKMSSRKGTAVYADDMMDEIVALAKQELCDRFSDLSDNELERRAEAIGLTALKFHLLKYNPRSRIQFDPQSSISFRGDTGPYCLYTYARIQSILRNLDIKGSLKDLEALKTDEEMDVIRSLRNWPKVFSMAVDNLDPSVIASYTLELCGKLNTLYNADDHNLSKMENERRKRALVVLVSKAAEVIRGSLDLLGIDALEEM